MILDGKRLSRRPWSLLDTGYITHIDGVSVKNLYNLEAFHVCLHSAEAFLNHNNRGCHDPKGWFWPSIIIENFSVSNLTQGIGIFITDGMIPDVDLNVSIVGGVFIDLDADSIPIVIRKVNFSTATLGPLLFHNVTNKVIDIDCCYGKDLYIEHCAGFKLKRTNHSRIDSITCTDCEDLDLTDWEKDTPIKVITTTGIKGSFALAVMIDGKIYKTEISNATFTR